MLRKLFFLFTLFGFIATQAIASSCSVACSYLESVQVKKSTNDQKVGHDCCPSSEKGKSEKKARACHGYTEGGCFHSSSDLNSIVTSKNTDIKERLYLKELPVLNFINQISLNYRFQPRVVQDDFFLYRAHLDLYLLKDQFLI